MCRPNCSTGRSDSIPYRNTRGQKRKWNITTQFHFNSHALVIDHNTSSLKSIQLHDSIEGLSQKIVSSTLHYIFHASRNYSFTMATLPRANNRIFFVKDSAENKIKLNGFTGLSLVTSIRHCNKHLSFRIIKLSSVLINPLRPIGSPVTHPQELTYELNWPDFAASPVLFGWLSRNFRHTVACINFLTYSDDHLCR